MRILFVALPATARACTLTVSACTLTVCACTLTLCGCALIDAEEPDARPGAWLTYLSGEDLLRNCDIGAPDSFRLVYRPPDRSGFQILDVIGNEAGGAVIHPLSLPAGTAPRQQEEARPTVLKPGDLDALLYKLDRLGLFTPMPGGIAPTPDGSLSWLISACLDGVAFQNLSVRSEGGVKISDRVRVLLTRPAPRSATGPAASNAKPTANQANPEAVR
ncbi:MAG: hypothetical protein WCF85_00780 [Rhodospirillaceae bacterium]